MSPHSRITGVSSVLATLALIGVVAAPESLSAPAPSSLNKPLAAGYDAAAVDQARSGALRKLQDPECLKILTDFRDREGRTLAENLDTWGVSAAQYLRMLPFLNGAALPLCRRNTAALTSVPGLPPIYVCPASGGHLRSRLAEVEAENPSLAEAMVIHEMLHTLGLGENPPAPSEITARVRARCR